MLTRSPPTRPHEPVLVAPQPARPAPPLPTRPELEPLSIDVETDAHGRAIAVVTGIGIDARAHPIDLRRWAAQLNAAADVLETHAASS